MPEPSRLSAGPADIEIGTRGAKWPLGLTHRGKQNRSIHRGFVVWSGLAEPAHGPASTRNETGHRWD